MLKLHNNSLNERIYAQPVDQPVLAVTRSQSAAPPVVNPVSPQVSSTVPPSIIADRARVRILQLRCKWMRQIIHWLENNSFPRGIRDLRAFRRKTSLFQMFDSVLWYVPADGSNWRLVLPEALRADVLREFHDNGGHLRGPRFVKKVQDRCYWPNLSSDVQRFEKGCIECQRGKSATWRQTVPLSTLSELTWRPFQSVAVDTIVNLPTSVRGNKHLIVLVDYFSRWPVAFPVPDLSLHTWVRCFTEQFITNYGCPERLVSDRGGQFIGDLAMALYKYLRIHKNSTTAYHPMANGLAERFNQTIIHGLRSMISDHQRDWDEHLPWFLFAYRTSVNPDTKCTPFELVMGQQARVPYDSMLRTYDEPRLKLEPRLYLRQLLQNVGEQRARARALSEKSRARNATYYNRDKKSHVYAKGDRVWLYYPVVSKTVKPKLSKLWRGPFVISDVLSDVTYRLQLPNGSRVHNVIHANRLRKFVDQAQSPDYDLELDSGGTKTSDPDRIIRIDDERIRTTGTGTRHREYLVQIGTTGGIVTKWIDEHFIISGDLIYAFRQRQKQHSALQLQDEADGQQVFVCRQDVCNPKYLDNRWYVTTI